MNMRLLGAPTLAHVGPDMVDANNIHQHIVSVPSDRLYDANCMSQRLITRKKMVLIARLDESMRNAELNDSKRDIKGTKLSKL